MRKNYCYLSILCCMMMLSGCIDKEYDLSDINTDVELKVNDLTLPINIDEIKLDDVISLDSNSKIKIIDGKYAVVVEGEYESDEVEFDGIIAAAPQLSPCKCPIISGKLSFVDKQFTYFAKNIDSGIHSIDKARVKPMMFYIDFSANSKEFALQNLILKMPTGMDAEAAEGSYDSESGLLTVSQLHSINGMARVGLRISGMNFTSDNSTFDYASHLMSYFGNIQVISGDVTTSDKIDLLDISYTLSDMNVFEFNGDIEYVWKNFDMGNINLSDIPSFLAQEGTDIIIENPQIYLSFTNPMSECNAWGSVFFELTTKRSNSPSATFSPDNGNIIIGKESQSLIFNYYFAPQTVDSPYPGYPNLIYEKFSQLSNILSGNGLPENIGINVKDARYPLQKIKGLKLDKNLGKIKGHYTFYAPLNLKEGSVIVYSSTQNGWNDDDIDGITIKTMEITALVTNNTSCGMSLSGYPINISGEQINDVIIEGAEIPANVKDYPITLRITGEVKHLDGLTYTAYCRASDAGKPLQPDQSLSLKNIKVKVSGNYITNL